MPFGGFSVVYLQIPLWKRKRVSWRKWSLFANYHQAQVGEFVSACCHGTECDPLRCRSISNSEITRRNSYPCPSASLPITVPKVRSDLLMWLPSFNVSPKKRRFVVKAWARNGLAITLCLCVRCTLRPSQIDKILEPGLKGARDWRNYLPAWKPWPHHQVMCCVCYVALLCVDVSSNPCFQSPELCFKTRKKKGCPTHHAKNCVGPTTRVVHVCPANMTASLTRSHHR